MITWIAVCWPLSLVAALLAGLLLGRKAPGRLLAEKRQHRPGLSEEMLAEWLYGEAGK